MRRCTVDKGHAVALRSGLLCWMLGYTSNEYGYGPDNGKERDPEKELCHSVSIKEQTQKPLNSIRP